MIAKHVPMRSLGKSDFAGLANYITDAQSKDHRLGHVQATNCEAGSIQDAITEVLATQHTNTRARGDKTYHLIVSFRAGEQPSADTLRAIEERICAGLGYGEHQRISAVHNDTDNLHIHIAINKTHPTRHTMHEPYYPHRALAELCTALERDYGLERDNHEPRKRGAEGRAADMERHAGVDSLVGWIKRECLDEIKGVQSWQDLHQVMRENGLALHVRANGLVFEASDGTMVKASTVARDLSKPSLEARLGTFEASPERQAQTTAKRQYRKDPIRLRVNTVELYAKYKAEQQSLTTARGQALERARHRKDRLIEAVKRSNRLRRATIKVVGEGRTNKKLLYAQASKALRGEIQAINKQFQQERTALYAEHSRRTWADWLKKEAQHGSTDALAALRAREAAQGLKGNTIRGEGQTKPGHAPVVDNITKKGTIIFRAGMSAVRDDGDRLQVSREATREGLQEALRLAMQRYGNRITVNGTVEFKAQIIRAAVDSQLPITFADPALESRRQALLKKENTHERTEKQGHRGRTGRGAGGFGQRPPADQHATGAAAVARAGDGRPAAGRGDSADAGIHAAHVHRKPDVGRLGRKPPPQSQHRLRALSELGVVRIAGGSEVLLPRDVPRHVEQQGTQPDHALRRGVPWPGTGVGQTPPGVFAVDKYIAEREDKRLKGFDIPKHSRYTAGEGAFLFQGTRNVEGQALALLKRGEEVMVMPIDQATARRLTRIAVGDAVLIVAKGSIKTTKGRSR
ncbi:TraI/MobA(P) family conjugative relaxase [Xylophilus ampelinus]|uniref:Relaxase/mobilization nuclease-like protein n=1 Tax=Xylophilus ampelinus TaxID=54067 RepID=A0A318SGI9_9BURK|nr:TraI/MobA(P) family conjugative relaxase [Xylophilus ampelinus]MCS4511807.1 relaxase/mobilization nuclease domain-containing protein [Xylophilus ampelinus]PYE73381.1 relaxase/mobilization nuclease-like protein [Xylophilus ampelinus]